MRVARGLMYILHCIAAATLYIMLVLICKFVIDELVEIQIDGLDHVMYLGAGVLSYYPCKFLLEEGSKKIK
jgi:hypothetical protein